jgi:predicted acetyltransferase
MDYQIRNPKDIKEINNIFSMLEECFPKIDRAYFIKRILGDPYYEKKNTYLLIKDNSFVSHIQIFKKKIYYYGKQLPIVGLGAICTSPTYRRKGYCRRLLEKIIQDIENEQVELIILFTRLHQFYEKIKFSKIVGRHYLLKQKEGRVMLPLKCKQLKVRSFNFNKDILPIMEIYENFFSCYFGPSVREFKDWQLQLSYFNEDRKLFLILEEKNEIKAYIRCKRSERSNQKVINIVEFATKDKDSNFLIYLLNYLFKSTNTDYLSIADKFIRDDLSKFFEIKLKDNSLLMYKLIKENNKEIDKLKMEEMFFLESDAF